jgi:hypothetical protein
MVSNILDAFEESFERLVEGSVGRAFRSSVQPAEIGRKLERAMVTNQVVSVDSTLVPNDYRVALHPNDMVAFADFIPSLCRQMEGWLGDVADRHGFTIIDRMRVLIDGDDTVPRRAIKVTASIADRPGVDARKHGVVQGTEVIRVIGPTSGLKPVRITFTNGPLKHAEFLIRKPVTTMGRALDNDLVVESSEVSRHHARLELEPEGLRIIDLNSTNGTRVNGRSIRSHRVEPNDEVTFGTLAARVTSVGNVD